MSIFFIKKTFSSSGNKVLVESPENSYEYSLLHDGIFSVQGQLGITKFEIKNQKVRIIDSPCPNKTCVNMSWNSPVVCLPNKIFIRIVNSSEEEEFDAISQ